MGRVHAGRSRMRDVVLRNDGIFPAIARLELGVNKTIQLAGSAAAASLLLPSGSRAVSVTVAPGQSVSLPVLFAPDLEAVAAAPTCKGFVSYDDGGGACYSADALVTVSHNPFALDRIRVRGSAFQSDVILEGVAPDSTATAAGGDGSGSSRGAASGADGLLVLPEIDLSSDAGASVSARITVCNKCERPVRFAWPSASGGGGLLPAGLSFSPRVGHIPAGGRRDITVTFRPAAAAAASGGGAGPVVLDCAPVTMVYHRITYDPQLARVATDERARFEDAGGISSAVSGVLTGRPNSSVSTKGSGKGGPTPISTARSSAGSGPTASSSSKPAAAASTKPSTASTPAKGSKGTGKKGGGAADDGSAATPSRAPRRLRARLMAVSEPIVAWDSNLRGTPEPSYAVVADPPDTGDDDEASAAPPPLRAVPADAEGGAAEFSTLIVKVCPYSLVSSFPPAAFLIHTLLTN